MGSLRVALVALVIVAVSALLGGWFSPELGLRTGGGSTILSASISETEAVEGTTFSVTGASKLPFDHAMSVRYRYIAGAYAQHVGQSDRTLTYTDYFADHGLSHNESKLIDDIGLYDGDSLYVNVTVATVDSSVVLDTLERGYLIDHNVITLALTNDYANNALLNPTGLVPTTTVECDTNQYRSLWVRRSAVYRDTCLAITTVPTRIHTTLPLFAVATDAQYSAFWWDLDALLPDNITIVEAYLSIDFGYGGGTAFAEGDGWCAVLDTLSSDVDWTTAPASACNTNDPHMSNTTWENMVRKRNPQVLSPWVPTLDTRGSLQQWGIASPLALDSTGDPNVLATGDDVKIDVKEVLQYWVDFHNVRDIKQAGFWISGKRAAGQVALNITSGTAGTAEANSPSLIIRYQQKAYDGYDWNGYPFVFVFTTDDGDSANLNYAAELESRGMNYTAFLAGEYVGTAGHLSIADVQGLHASGHEMANHGATHTRLAEVDSAAAKVVINRGWLATILGLSGADTLQIQSYAYANGDTGATTDGLRGVSLMNRWYYYGARLAGNIQTTSATPLLWDTTGEVFKVDKWNWNMLADNNDTHPDSVRAKLRRVYGTSAYRGGPDGGEPIIVLTHGEGDSEYIAEMDHEVLGVLLDEIQRRGDTAVMTFGQMMSLYRAAHTSVGGQVWTLP